MSINKCHVAVKLPLFYIVHAKSNALYSLYYFTLLQNIASVVWNRLSNIQLIVILFFFIRRFRIHNAYVYAIFSWNFLLKFEEFYL